MESQTINIKRVIKIHFSYVRLLFSVGPNKQPDSVAFL